MSTEQERAEAKNVENELHERLSAADRYMDRPDADIFSEEGLRHLKTIVEDVDLLAQKAMILSGKQRTEQAAGSSATFDLFWQARTTAKASTQTEVIIKLIESTMMAKQDRIDLDTLRSVLAVHLKMVITERRQLMIIGSSIEHLIHRAPTR